MASRQARNARHQRRYETGGAVLASFKNPPVGSGENKRYVFKPHQSIKQRLRNLRQMCRPVLHSKDPEVQTWGHKIIAEVKGFDIPEYRALCLIAQALEYVDSTGVTFPEAAEVIIDKVQKAKAEHNTTASTDISTPTEGVAEASVETRPSQDA